MEGSYASLKAQKAGPFEIEIELFNSTQLLGLSTAIVGGAFAVHYYLKGLLDLVAIFGLCALVGLFFSMLRERVVFNNKHQAVEFFSRFLFREKREALYYSKINSVLFVPFGEFHATAGIFLKLYDGKRLFVVIGESEEIKTLSRKISEFIGKELVVVTPGGEQNEARDETQAAA